MLFFDHLIHQGAIPAILARMAGADPYTCTAILLIAGAPNMDPDTRPFYEGLKDPNSPLCTRLWGFIPYRNDIYRKLHDTPRWWCKLHVWVDKALHASGENWWPREWRLALTWWGLEACALALIYL